MTSPAPRTVSSRFGGRARGALGLVVGLVLLALVVSRVDPGAVIDHLAEASPRALVAAIAVVLLDLAIRGLRWRALLEALPGPPVRTGRPIAYLCIGYLANLLLPARLGDLARAYLAGSAFGRARLGILGTIVVERLSDGTTMLALGIASSLLVSGVATAQALATDTLVLAVAALAVIAVAWWLAERTSVGRVPLVRTVRDLAARMVAGAAALRSAVGAATVVGATIAAAATAIAVAWLVAASVGLALGPLQAVLFMSAVALSLAIPAAPGSLGTYELVGVVVLTSLGADADRALAIIILMRAVSTLPPIAIGIAATWALHLRPGVILRAAGSLEPDPGGEASA